MVTFRRGKAELPLAVLAMGCVLLGACASRRAAPGAPPPAATSTAAGSTAASSTAAGSTAAGSTAAGSTAAPIASLAPGEAIVRQLVLSGTDRFGWVQAPAKAILEAYFGPGQRYLGGQLVAPTDQILVLKMHGSFSHSAPAGAKSTAVLALIFYNASTDRRIPFVQMWDEGAPDLGIGGDPGIADRDLAARRWDLRLVGTPIVRARGSS